MANLEKALKKCLRWEGGYANDPDDTGGPTMRGVTINTYKEYCKRVGKPVPTVSDLKKITNEEIYDLADKLFWSKIRGNEIKNQSIANLCFDSVWGSGTKYIKVIQQVLGVEADGVFGQKSLAAMNDYEPQQELFNKLWNRRKVWFEGCAGAWKYINGWMNRLRSFNFDYEVDGSLDTAVEEQNETAQSDAPVKDDAPQQTESKGFFWHIIEFFKMILGRA